MAYSYEDIIRSQYEAKAAEKAQALADLEAARINENAVDTMAAADRIVEIDKSVGALDRIANQYVASQQAQPQGNRFGLSPTEVEIAHNAFSGVSKEEKERSYAENRDRLRRMRASGEYRDDQGSVRR
jgi:hypothetical protein